MNDEKSNPLTNTGRPTLEQVLVKCIHTLATADDFDIAFHSFLAQLGCFYRASRAYMLEFDYENQTIRNTYEWRAPTTAAMDRPQELPMEDVAGWVERLSKQGECFISSVGGETARDPAGLRILAGQDIESLLAAPLTADGRIIGFIGVNDPTCATDDLTLLQASSHFVVEELKKRRLISRLEHAGYTDMLTGLNNRNRYTEVLKEYRNNPPSTLGVIFADINGMKSVNDTYGHKYGDKLLIRVAGLLKQTDCRHIYRIGGDEFVLLFDNIERDGFQQKVAELRKRLDASYDCDVSLGCVWKAGEMDVNSQITLADELMYAEKQSYYKNVLNSGHPIRIGITSEVAREISGQRFVVFFQPQINLKTGEIIGAEALVRKRGVDDELIPPDKFIPYYEIEGVIRHIDMFVLETVCATMQKWQKQQIFLNISVNFSRVTLMEPNIVADILSICNKYGISPKDLTIEVTESISRLEHEQFHALINSLIRSGFTVSLDDFGSKYSNLSILNDISFHVIKLDKSLIDQLEDNKKSQVILKNTIRMCQELENTHTLAEGIESAAQRNLLADYECEYGQGFFFSKPLSLEHFNELLQKGCGAALW